MAATKRQILMGIVVMFVVGIVVLGVLKRKDIKEAFAGINDADRAKQFDADRAKQFASLTEENRKKLRDYRDFTVNMLKGVGYATQDIGPVGDFKVIVPLK